MTFKFQCTYVILLLSIYVLPNFKVISVKCPYPCKCNGTVANCSPIETKHPRLKYIPPFPSTITELIFSFNYISTITNQTFSNITSLNLTTLKLDHCNISTVLPGAITALSYLKALDLSYNFFEGESVVHVMSDVRASNLFTLSLSGIGMKKLPEVENMCPPTLKELDISYNKLDVLGDVLVRGCPKLKILTLSGNYIDNFNFSNVPQSVEGLNISAIRLCRGIPRFCKDNGNTSVPILPSLTYLNMSFNSFDNISIFNRDGACLSNLTTLILDGCFYIRIIPPYAISNLSSLEYISFNLMNPKIHLEDHALQSKSLQSLNMQPFIDKYFPITDASLYILSYCPNLLSLSMKNIKFTFFNQSHLITLFSNLQYLEHLKIENGHISSVDFLQKLPRLKIFELHGNYIDKFTSVLASLNLTFLDMSKNNFTEVNPNFFPRYMSSGATIDLRNNPFACSNTLCKFREWINDNKKKLTGFPDKYYCASPGKKKGLRLQDWHPTNEECNPSKQTQDNYSLLIEIGIIVPGVMLIAGIITIIIYRKRWYIKHYIYLMRSKRGYQLIPDGEDLLYDAFVAYHYNNRAWIIQNLLPYLESQKKMKICLHERDFLPGNFIADNIISNIEASRKVILVLSNDFSKSEWCQFEATTALKRVTTMGASTVLIILLEEISSKNMTSVLKNLLETITYIEWTTDSVGGDTFWKRLDNVII